MSAIFGIVWFDGGTVSTRDLERMGNVLAHRGPNGRKFVVANSVGLGHCLMHVNQEDLFEGQPLHDREADLTLVADCRIDNREELARVFGLSADQIRDMPDSAFILRAYKTWGENCAEHLLGDFAFAIWEGGAMKLVLGRDHMGQRYVHYHHGKSFFVFSTEIKALWAIEGVPRKISEIQFGKYLVLDSRQGDGETFFEGVLGVTGGTTISVQPKGSIATRRYWLPRPGAEHIGRDEAYYVETYRRIFAEAVACRIRRLVAAPALSFSAGYDSTAIAALCGPIVTAQGRRLITVSSVMPEDYRGPLPCVRRWVELCRRDMPHLDVRYFVRGGETMFTDLERTFLAADRVPGVSHYVIDALFREAAAAGARLMMNGIGGDSTLNPRFDGALAYFLGTGQIGRFIAEFIPHLRMSGHSLWQTVRYDIVALLMPLWLRRAAWAARRGFSPLWSTVPIVPSFASALFKAGAIDNDHMLGSYWRRSGRRTAMQYTLSSWASVSCPNGANLAAAHGLDITRPLMDKRVVEFGLSIPENLYVKNGRDRYLACRALADIYPKEYQTRPRQQDPIEPNLVKMLQDCHPQLRTEIERMAHNPVLLN